MTIKAILKEFVAYLESVAYSGERDPGSPFEQAVNPKLLAQMEVALCAARSPDEQVILLTNGTPARALVAGFLLRETGLTMETKSREDKWAFRPQAVPTSIRPNWRTFTFSRAQDL